ncbi:protein-L-isoaspartate O-methyltransferase [Hydrogenophaga sp. 5NK40-0174]|uniref:protein-L-isoaspartate O-methyltransferase family protein n=1 Tax=Hydrogenophaga sp. 5NK40-0174 TaxID=3127649 RepID=UPI00310342E9
MTTMSPASSLDLAQARFNMIEQQVRPWDVLDRRVLDLLDRVPRERFLPEGLQALAYSDVELPVAPGHLMLAPRVQARLIQDLDLQPQDTVLEIGTGTGYMTALLSQLAAKVVSVEVSSALAVTARANLQSFGALNAEVRNADACAEDFAACRDGAPWNAIVLTGSVAAVPAALLDLLAPGGRLIAITGEEPVMRATVTTRQPDGSFSVEQPWDAVAPRLKGFPEMPAFHF